MPFATPPATMPPTMPSPSHGRATTEPADRARRAGVLALLALAGLAGYALGRPAAAEAMPDMRGTVAQQGDAQPTLNGAGTRLVWLPELATADATSTCDSQLKVSNLGHDPSKATLVTWGEAGDCPPQSRGPLKVECSGLLLPGGSWTFSGPMLPTGSQSGLVVSFIARPLSELGLDMALGFDDIAADLMCETLFFGIVGDADDFRRFLKAYAEGGSFAGLPQDRVRGAPLAVELRRACADPADASVSRLSSDSGIPARDLGPSDLPSWQVAPLAPRPPDGRGRTHLVVQNAGLSCASVDIELRAEAGPEDASPCRLSLPALAPGEQHRFDVASCEGLGEGPASARIRGSQPLAVMVDLVVGDTLSSYAAEPLPAADAETVGPAGRVHHLPLLYRAERGWSSRIHVQNQDPIAPAKLRIEIRDREGNLRLVIDTGLLPGRSQSIDLADYDALPAGFIGSARVESVATGPTDTAGPPPAISVVVASRHEADGGPIEAFAYGLQAPRPGDGATAGSPGPTGSGLIALPSFMRHADATGLRATELAIVNRIDRPGFTDFALLIYDANGLLDFSCHKLTADQVSYIDLTDWGSLPPGFTGSAIVSATVWDHPALDPAGLADPPVDLAAVGVLRADRSLGDVAVDPAGDGSFGGAGFALPMAAEARFAPLPAAFTLCGLPARPLTTPTAWPPLWTPTPRPTPSAETPTATALASDTPARPGPTDRAPLYLPWLDPGP